MEGPQHPHLAAYLASHGNSARVSVTTRPNSRYYLSEGPKIVCWACLGEHESTNCTQKRCYRCGRPGHESQQCVSDEYCGFCGGAGHVLSSQCYRQVYNAGLDPRLHDEVLCYNCGELGHVNCFKRKVVRHKRMRSDR